MKHKHHDLIVKWAANPSLNIEVSSDGVTWGICPRPNWVEDFYYRIKPEIKTMLVHIGVVNTHCVTFITPNIKAKATHIVTCVGEKLISIEEIK